ncbi:MAG: LysR substrate-binding domain-containing protein [Pseudobdellovibrio sp.]
MKTIKSLQGIISFVQVAESGSFSKAAKDLSVSKSHISKNISNLEKELGTSLFLRSTRKVRLTSLGEKYLTTCKQSLTNIQSAKEEILNLSETPHGSLRISVAGIFGEEYVAPVIVEIAKKYPHLKIELSFNSQYVDLIEEKFDVAVRVGELKDSSLIAQKIASRLEYIVCSKSYLNNAPPLKDITDLKNHNCIGEKLNWSFRKKGKYQQITLSGNLRSNNPRVILKAAVAGLGIAKLAGSYVSDDLKKGRLISVLESYQDGKKDIWIVTPSSKSKNINVKIFIQELKKYITQEYSHTYF